jgi:two-component system, OmpR family, aerobic respiration control sensor histidine kinase ArcB
MDDRSRMETTCSGGPPASDETARFVEALQRFGHDMRAAVSDVVGGLRLVDLDRLDPETRTQLERVAAAGDALASLVESALLIASGPDVEHIAEGGVPLSSLVEHWRKRWTGHATETGVSFEVIVDADPGLSLLVPRMTVERIVSNVISNALDHAAGCDVWLTVRMDKDAGLVMEVADAGPGFDPSAPLASGEGRGLGLKIARELSEQLGATLRIGRGPPLGGAVVQLVLPLALIGMRGPVSRQDAKWPDLSEVEILVAEDNPTNQAILRGMLERLGARPVFTSNGAEALEALEQVRFDIALIDIEMPLLSGLEVMRAVRARSDAAAAMPLVALTAYVLRDNREAIYAAGADGIIGKPVSSIEEFGRTILRYAGRPAGLPEPEDLLATGAEDPAFGVKMDEARLDDLLVVAGEEGARELLERLTEDLCALRDRLDAGIAARSVPIIREQTHILVAISGAVGADRLCRLSEVLNIAAKRRRIDDLEALHAPCRDDLDDLIALIAMRAATRG